MKYYKVCKYLKYCFQIPNLLSRGTLPNAKLALHKQGVACSNDYAISQFGSL